MIKQEWSYLASKKMFLLVVAAIIAIPTIYTTLFLGSMWDPYGKMDQLPVAVVNKDQPVVYEKQTLNVGNDLVERLKENDALTFNFVDEEGGVRGLKNGTYYMVITIPENFSQNATTLMDTQPQRMELKYDTNPGTNYIASKMSETALLKIRTSVANQVTRTYAETVFAQINKVGNGMDKAAKGSKKINKGIGTAANGNKTITDNLKVLSDSALTFESGSQTLSIGLKEYANGVTAVNTGANTLEKGAEDLSHGAASASQGADALKKGSASLASGTADLKNGSKQLKSGAAAASQGASSLSEGITSLQKNVKPLSAALPSLESGTGSLKSGIDEINTGSESLLSGAKQLNSGLETLDGKSAALNNGAKSVSEGLSQVLNSLGAGSANTSPQTADLKKTAENSASAAKNASQATVTSTEQLQDALDTAMASGDTDKISQIARQALVASTANQEAAAQANAQIQTLASQLKVSSSALTRSAEQLSVSSAKKAVPADLVQTLQKLQQASSTVASGTSDYTAGVHQLKTNSPQLVSGLQSLNGGTKQLSSGAADLHGGTKKLSDSSPALTEGINTLEEGAVKLDKGVSSLKTGSSALHTGVSQAKDGADQVSSGASALSDGTQKLHTGATQLAAGSGTLAAGTKQLTENSSALLNGSQQLTVGAQKIGSGTGLLYSGSYALGSGIKQLSDGSYTLSKQLRKGAKQLSDTNTSDDTINMFAYPVSSQETKTTTVENNGHAMAPYMMSVALWVACIAFCLMYPVMKYTGELKSGLRWWGSKASILYLIAVIQAVVMVGALHFFNGFHPEEMGKTLVVAVLTSATFMSILYFFNAWIGKVGSFSMLIIMVIQLAGSAGTYPVELSGSFVSIIHKWLPFTYSVDAFRSTISGGQSILPDMIVLLALFLIFTGLTIAMFKFRAKRIKAGKRVMNQLLEEKGLM